MTDKSEKAIARAAASELERLSLFLETGLEETDDAFVEEAEDDSRGTGANTNRPLPMKLSRLTSKEARGRQAPDASVDSDARAQMENLRDDSPGWPFHVYVSNEPLRDECADEVKLLILEIRHLARRQRYEEALYLARKATRIDPTYWRARINLGTLLVMFGKVDDGDEIFARVSEDFPDNPKAVAAGLHGRAWVKEIRCEFHPSAEELREAGDCYAKALELDKSRVYSRACLVFRQLMSDEVEKGRKLLEESVLCEGFFDALWFELNERRERARNKVLQSLPAWLRYLVRPAGSVNASGY